MQSVVHYADGKLTGINGTDSMIRRKKRMSKWIPTSERLPKPEGHTTYLVTIAHYSPDYKGRFVTTAEYEARFDDVPPFWSGNADDEGTRITAWMPLPEPYKGANDDEGESND
jgi:hypothetical protein